MKVPQHPTIDVEAWQVSVGGLLIPTDKCLTVVKKLAPGAKWDIKDPTGANGASATFQGTKLARFTLEFRAGFRGRGGRDETDSWALLWSLAADVWKAVKSGQWLEVDHPSLRLYEVSRMLVEDIDGPLYEDQVLRYSIDCVQWAPPPKKAAAVTATPTHGGVAKGLGVKDVFLPQDIDEKAATRPTPPSKTAFKPTLKKA